jgi:hypothetical protein
LVFFLLQGYVWHFGTLWVSSSEQIVVRAMEIMGDGWTTYSTPLKWLMDAHKLPVPSAQQQREYVVCTTS